MPLYEYTCLDCGKEFDALRPFRDADKPIACQFCSGERTIRQLSVFFAQSAGKIIAGNQGGGCVGCSGGSCSSCSH
jgi:putative FmdB family regulatory protein